MSEVVLDALRAEVSCGRLGATARWRRRRWPLRPTTCCLLDLGLLAQGTVWRVAQPGSGQRPPKIATARDARRGLTAWFTPDGADRLHRQALRPGRVGWRIRALRRRKTVPVPSRRV